MNTAKTLATLAALGLGAALMPSAAAEPPATPPKIGLIGDFQSVYSDIGGMGNVEATKMAIEEFGGTMFGKPIELITADAQNKADIAGSLARKWFENEAIDMIIDMPTSATALAGMEMSRQFEKIMIVTDAASSDITSKSCSLCTVHWTYDTYANADSVGSAIVKNGGNTWFFITADYPFEAIISRVTCAVEPSAAPTCA
jgi:branched-chain amino acid transport system substrate-binding protein